MFLFTRICNPFHFDFVSKPSTNNLIVNAKWKEDFEFEFNIDPFIHLTSRITHLAVAHFDRQTNNLLNIHSFMNPNCINIDFN